MTGACVAWAEPGSGDKVGGAPGGVLGRRDGCMESLGVSALESTSLGSSTRSDLFLVGAVLVCYRSL